MPNEKKHAVEVIDEHRLAGEFILPVTIAETSDTAEEPPPEPEAPKNKKKGGK